MAFVLKIGRQVCGLLKQTFLNDIDKEQALKIRQIRQTMGWIALGLGCLIHTAQIVNGTVLVAKDFEQLKDEKKLDTYNWELSEKIYPII